MSQRIQACEVCGLAFAWGADIDSAIVDAEGGQWKSCRDNAHWKLTFHIKQAHPGHGFYCGRRGEGSMFRDADFMDYWHNRDGHRVCSYCGSMHPEDLFTAIEQHAMVVGTDKNYKIYVELLNPTAGKPRVFSAITWEPSPAEIGGARGWVKITDDNRHLLGGDWHGSDYRYMKIGPQAATVSAKFYYQHFDADQQQRFLALYNGKKINLEPMFGLYRAPYFASRNPETK